MDESFITLKDGVAQARRGNIGPPVDPAVTTKVVEFNDLAALEQALAPGDVACVLAEPVMTNVGIVHPEPGYHQALRRPHPQNPARCSSSTRPTPSAPGPAATPGRKISILTSSSSARPLPAAFRARLTDSPQEVAKCIADGQNLEDCDTGGIGGTLAGNALSLAAMRATLTKVLTKEAFARMIPAAERWTAGVEKAITEFGLPWHVTRLGCRAEYQFSPARPTNGTQAHDAMDFELERFMHLYAMNRGILLTPFHNMALMSPQADPEDVDHHTRVFREAVKELVA